MDPVTLSAAAISLVTPYLVRFGTSVASSAAEDAGKSVWEWIKGKLTSPAGVEAVADAETAPEKSENKQALQAALTKFLVKEPDAANRLAELLQGNAASISGQTAITTGDNNKTGQASGGSTVNVS